MPNSNGDILVGCSKCDEAVEVNMPDADELYPELFPEMAISFDCPKCGAEEVPGPVIKTYD